MTPRSRRRKPICLTTWPRELRIVALAATAVALLCAIGAVVAPAVGLYPRDGRLDAGKVAITELPQRHALPGPAAAVRRPRHGQTPSAPLEPGETARIMTGAPIPAGADAVVMLERSRMFPIPVIMFGTAVIVTTIEIAATVMTSSSENPA